MSEYKLAVRNAEDAIAKLTQGIEEASLDALPYLRIFMSRLEKATDAGQEVIKRRLGEWLDTNGQVITTAGTSEGHMSVDDVTYSIRMVPTGRKDVDGLIAILRARGVDKLESFFKKEVKTTYKLTDTTLDLLFAMGHINEEEKKRFSKSLGYRLEVNASKEEE